MELDGHPAEAGPVNLAAAKGGPVQIAGPSEGLRGRGTYPARGQWRGEAGAGAPIPLEVSGEARQGQRLKGAQSPGVEARCRGSANLQMTIHNNN